VAGRQTSVLGRDGGVPNGQLLLAAV